MKIEFRLTVGVTPRLNRLARAALLEYHRRTEQERCDAATSIAWAQERTVRLQSFLSGLVAQFLNIQPETSPPTN